METEKSEEIGNECVNGSEPSFPIIEPEIPGVIGEYVHIGLTKRELFAAMALNGILSDSMYVGDVTKDSVRYADALLVELEGEPRQKA